MRTSPPPLKKPNLWGLHDMHGNVWEWCSDWDDRKLPGGTDPLGPDRGSDRVYCGGGWENYSDECRSAHRHGNIIGGTDLDNDQGFRVARCQQRTQAKPHPQITVEKRPVMEKPKPVEKVSKLVQTITNSIGMELIGIPAGKFTMGSPKGEKDREYNEAQVSVTLTKPFMLGKTEVTQGQWKSVMGTEPWDGQKTTIKGENVAATHVDDDAAADFCKTLTNLERAAGTLQANEKYRLPTEAEWEYACRAGTTTAFSFGDDESKLGEYAWFNGNTYDAGEQYPHEVGKKKPNPCGLHDMHGSVWEWCSDLYDTKLSGGVDPKGPAPRMSSRVSRGGCWGLNPPGCRSAIRGTGTASSNNYSWDIGFRVAGSQSAP